ncbi:hypothetical protein U1Q18_019653 [Sarracenia purpurea var. burkii]
MANTNQSKDDHCKEKPATDPDQPSLLSFRNSSRTWSRGWDPTSPVRSGGSDGATGGVFDFEEFLRCAVCLSQIPKNSISVLRLSRVALEIGGRPGILRNGAAPLAAVAFADDCGLSVEKIRALSRPSL